MFLIKISLFFLITITRTHLSSAAVCPCSDASLCKPVDYDGKENYAFVTKTSKSVWSKYDWTKLTTVALFNYYDPELYCLAHKNKVKVVNVGFFEKTDLRNVTKVNKWIADQLKYAKDKYLDGINIDVEFDVEKGSPEVDALSAFMLKVRDRFRAAIPKAQVTFDVPWAPYNEKGTGIDGRNYNFTALANASDFLFVMSYDEQSQIFGTECTARPNSNMYMTVGGIMAYLKMGIDANKLVMGLPWYGYDYKCIKTGPERACYLPLVPFRGVNCSDAAGQQVPYGQIKKWADKYGVNWDEHSQTRYLYFNDTTSNTTHQVWYDDSTSLSMKIGYAIYKNLRGTGMWNANEIDYSDQAEVNDIWGTLPDYKQIGKYMKNH